MRKHSFIKVLLAVVLALSMILTSTVLLIVATDEGAGAAPEKIAGDVSGNTAEIEILVYVVPERPTSGSIVQDS